MLKLRQEIGAALDTKQVPAFKPGDVGDLAVQLGLPRPITLSNLINVMRGLPWAVFTIDSGTLNASGVTGSAQVGLQANGAASFRGSVHSPGAGGVNYVFAVALLDVKDASGNTLVFAHQGNLFNAVQGSDDSWQIDGFNQLIADNWDTAKSTAWKAHLEFSANVIEDIATFLVDVFSAIGLTAIAIFLGGNNWRCKWSNQLQKCEANM